MNKLSGASSINPRESPPQKKAKTENTTIQTQPSSEQSLTTASSISSHQSQLQIQPMLSQTYFGSSTDFLNDLDSLYSTFVKENTFSNAHLLREYVAVKEDPLFYQNLHLKTFSIESDPNGFCVNQSPSLLGGIASKLGNQELGGLAIFSKNGISDHLCVFIPVHNSSDAADCGVFLFERGDPSNNPIFIKKGGQTEVSYSESGRHAIDSYTFQSDMEIIKTTTETGKGIDGERVRKTAIVFNPQLKSILNLSQNFVNGKRSLIFRANNEDGSIRALLGIKLASSFDESVISFKSPGRETETLPFEEFLERYGNKDNHEIMLCDNLSLKAMAAELNVDSDYLVSELLFSINNYEELRPTAAEKVLDTISSLKDDPYITWAEQHSKGDGVLRKNHNLEATSFGRSVLRGSIDDSFQNRKNLLSENKYSMSCFELPLYGAYKAGKLDNDGLKLIYETQSPCKYMDETLSVGCEKITIDNLAPWSEGPRPKAGDLVVWNGSTNQHVATAVGNTEGEIKVMSLHGDCIKECTLREVQNDMENLRDKEIQFYTPQW
jgi:hypothetical protein